MHQNSQPCPVDHWGFVTHRSLETNSQSPDPSEIASDKCADPVEKSLQLRALTG